MRRQFRDEAPQMLRARVHDLMASKHNGVFATEQIGLKRYKTPAGFLFVEDVPIARIGEMVYGPGEVPIQRSAESPYIIVERGPEELFKLETLLSFQGADITNDHPPDDVDPKNWKSVTVGHIMNPRRGDGPDSDVILADFLIKDAAAIAAVEAGKVEVSCGYDAFYKQTAPGRGLQTDIVGNHVALVERGRCGPRCAIGDRQPDEEDDMRTRDNAVAAPANDTTPAGRIRRHFNDAAEAAIKDLGAGGGDGVNVHVHLGGSQSTPTVDGKTTPNGDDAPVTQGQLKTVADSIAKLVGAVEKLVKGPTKTKHVTADADLDDDGEDKTPTDDDAEDDDEDGDDKKKDKDKTEDSKALAKAFKDTLSGVEILVPGLSLPTFDAKKPRAITMDSMCKLRTKALDRFSLTPHGEQVLKNLSAGKGYDSMTMDCRDTAVLFKSAVAAQKALGNAGTVGDSAFRTPAGQGTGTTDFNYRPRTLTPVEINERNKAYWLERGVKG